jgi:hypothetical protein
MYPNYFLTEPRVYGAMALRIGVQRSMVVSAQQHQVIESCLTALRSMHDVMRIDEPRLLTPQG